MEGEYPRFKSSYLQEELAEGFQLGPDEFDFVYRYRGDHNRHGIAILLKSLLYQRRTTSLCQRSKNSAKVGIVRSGAGVFSWSAMACRNGLLCLCFRDKSPVLRNKSVRCRINEFQQMHNVAMPRLGRRYIGKPPNL